MGIHVNTYTGKHAIEPAEIKGDRMHLLQQLMVHLNNHHQQIPNLNKHIQHGHLNLPHLGVMQQTQIHHNHHQHRQQIEVILNRYHQLQLLNQLQ